MASNTSPNLPVNLTTTTHILNPTDLNTSPHLPALFTLINNCFNISHNPPGHSYLPFSPTTRLKTPTQLSEEIGPNGFTIIMLASNAETKEQEAVIATASAKPYTPPNHTPHNSATTDPNNRSENLFKRQPGTLPSAYAALPKWELLATVVEPSLQGRGIAAQLMDLTIAEIKRRVRVELAISSPTTVSGRAQHDPIQKVESEGKEKETRTGQILLLLSSMQELNEAYYAKRGWITTGIRRFEPGMMGSRDGFGIVEMMRVV